MSWKVGENVFTEKPELTLLISLTNTESGQTRNVEREYGFNFIENEDTADARWMQQRYEDGFMKWMKITF